MSEAATVLAGTMPPSLADGGERTWEGRLESVACYLCGAGEHRELLTAEDDYTGRPGSFRFVRCTGCGLVYQNPRLTLEAVAEFYDESYLAHRRRADWGVLTGFFEWVMARHDRQKEALLRRQVALRPGLEVLDVGCAVGTFLQRLRARYQARVTGVDFKDLSAHPSLSGVEFHCGLFYEQPLARDRFDLVTMWHFLEHDYDPLRTLRKAREVMKPDGRLVIEVPRLDSLTFRLFGRRWPGVQAPQHTVLYDRRNLLAMVRAAGLEVETYLPYGAFPAFFYFFAGAAFTLLRGRGLNLSRAIYPYFVGQLLCAPLLAFEKQLNFAMQTVVCRRPA
jgi:2-polyprenyl-3-methyl-5-hydroxy-6-metoxy-1,4-benzoquinol methylase